MTKKCPKCKLDKPLSDFGIDRSRSSGLNTYCKPCARYQTTLSKSRNAGRVTRTTKGCPSCGSVKPSSEFYANRSSKDLLSYECITCDKKRVKNYYRTNTDVLKKRSKDWYQDNKDRALERSREWQRSNPHRVGASNNRRRVRKRGTLTEWDLKLSAQWRKVISKMPCYYCGTTEAEKYHVDHRIPVSKGGDDSWVNLVRACEPCNLSKSAKTDAEFFGWSR